MRFLSTEELYLRRGQDVILRLAGVVDGEPNLARVTAAIEAAEAEAVSYLSARYSTLPESPAAAPAVLKDKVAALAHRHLAGSSQVSQVLQDEAAESRAWLSRVARGTANLGLEGAPEVDRGTAQVLVAQTNPGTALTFDSLEDW